MRGVEAFFLQFAAVELGVGARGQEGQEQGLVAGLLALGLQFLDMVGMADLLAAVIAAGVGGDELFVVKEQQLIGIELEGQLLRGVEVGDRIAVGVEDDVAAAVGADWVGRPRRHRA